MKIHRKPPNSKCSPSQVIFFAMSVLASLSVLSLILFFSISSSTHHNDRRSPAPKQAQLPPGIPSPIHLACGAARFPRECESSLSGSDRIPPDPKAIDIIASAVALTYDGLSKARAMVEAIVAASAGNANRTSAATNCLETFANAVYRTSSAAVALPSGKNQDAVIWLSATHQYVYGCWSALSYVNGTKAVDETMSFLVNLTKLSSNTLSMSRAFDSQGDDLASWAPPKTERDGNWGTAGSKRHSPERRSSPAELPANITVCKGGAVGCHSTVQEAVNAAPANGTTPFVIQIKEGVYEETVRIPLEKRFIVFSGDGMGKTVITGSAKVGPGVTTYSTATVGVSGDGFFASGMTFENNAPPETRQAVAFRSDSDMSVVENCEFLGNQDTLYAQSMRQYYKNNRIEGNVDFIFGNAAAVFENCTILVRPRQVKPEKGETNAVTAHGRTDPGEWTGFVFDRCVVDGTEEYVKLYASNRKVHRTYLGRPWKEYSRTVFIRCSLGEIISPDGWLPWRGDFALSTLFYGEFGNSGTGGNVSARVWWSSRIPVEHVDVYLPENFIQRDRWLF